MILLNPLNRESYLPPTPDLSILLSGPDYLLLIFLTHCVHSSFYSSLASLLLPRKKKRPFYSSLQTYLLGAAANLPHDEMSIPGLIYVPYSAQNRKFLPETLSLIFGYRTPPAYFLGFQVSAAGLFATWDLDPLSRTSCCPACRLAECSMETAEERAVDMCWLAGW